MVEQKWVDGWGVALLKSCTLYLYVRLQILQLADGKKGRGAVYI